MMTPQSDPLAVLAVFRMDSKLLKKTPATTGFHDNRRLSFLRVFGDFRGCQEMTESRIKHGISED
jgi:hypothetical protein